MNLQLDTVGVWFRGDAPIFVHARRSMRLCSTAPAPASGPTINAHPIDSWELTIEQRAESTRNNDDPQRNMHTFQIIEPDFGPIVWEWGLIPGVSAQSNSGSPTGVRPDFDNPCSSVRIPNREWPLVLGTPEAGPASAEPMTNRHSGVLRVFVFGPPVAAVWHFLSTD